MAARKTKIIAIGAQKGGTGKTTCAVNLATNLAQQGSKTLFLDFDFQSNGSFYLGVLLQALKNSQSLYEVMVSKTKKLNEVIIKTRFPNLDAVACNDLFYEFNLKGPRDFELAVVMKEKVIDDYDYVVIDTRPALDATFTNACMAAHYYIIPIMCQPDTIFGLQITLSHLTEMQKVNNSLRLLGCVVSQYSKKVSLQKNKYLPFINRVLERYDIPLLGILPRSDSITGSVDSMTPLEYYRPNNTLPIRGSFQELSKNISEKAVRSAGRKQRINWMSRDEARQVYISLLEMQMQEFDKKPANGAFYEVNSPEDVKPQQRSLEIE